MMRYTWKRILTGIVSLFLLATVTFFLVRLIPGSPFQRGGVSEQVVEAVEEEYGLNDPLIEQYLSYMGNLLKGDLGISYQDPGTSVEEIIGRAAPLTVSLGLSALIVSVIVGTGCGVFYAASEKRAVKKVIGSLGMLAAGIPGFAAAILLLMVFSVKLKWFPSSGLFSFSHYILPVTALSLYPTAVITRMTGHALDEEMAKDYVLFARAKGLKKSRIIFTHALKNAWFPVLNYIGPASAFLLTGSFAIESVFTIPGLGREYLWEQLLFFLICSQICLGHGLIQVSEELTERNKKKLVSGTGGRCDKNMRKENRISSKKRKGYRDEKAALIILLIWIFLAVCVPLFGPYSPTEQNAEIRNQPMSLIHFFGTDEFGRDNFTRVWYGAGISLVIGVGSSLINGMIGILYGAVAGYRGKRIDMILMRAADVIAAIPSILYVILITLVMGPGIKSMIFGICIAGWIDMARVVRGEMIRLKETDFAAAAKIDGISGIRILFRHLLPNALGMIVVNFLFLIPQAIFTEAFLSFLGVGLSAPTASLGTLIQEGRDRMILYPCELLAPLITLCVLLVVFHILAMAMERRGGQTD